MTVLLHAVGTDEVAVEKVRPQIDLRPETNAKILMIKMGIA